MPLMRRKGPSATEGKVLDEGHDTESITNGSPDEPGGTRERGRRRRLIRVGVVVLAVLLLVVVPGYVASRPAFFRYVPGMAEEHESWSVSTHVETACAECHLSPRILPQAAYRVRMAGEFYLTLVLRSREPRLFEAPTNEACLECHSDLRTVSPKGDLQIPHRAHVTILEMDCVECHKYLVHDVSPEGKHTPPMEDCLRCHDGDIAKDSCWACHTQKAAPKNHTTSDWLITHATLANDPECETCHKWAVVDFCADCHTELPRSHGADWRATHGDAVKVHRSCEACHEAAFCVRCHGEVPQLNFDPTLKLVE
jgi:hypothetical protein